MTKQILLESMTTLKFSSKVLVLFVISRRLIGVRKKEKYRKDLIITPCEIWLSFFQYFKMYLDVFFGPP